MRLRLLAELHRDRNRRPIADTVNALLEATRAHAGFALRPAGHQVLANVYRVADLARNFELSGGISFRGFVEELEAQAEKAESAEAPVLEEGADGVRLMTVHSAKGLEFPVVILADMTANIAAGDPDRYVDARNVFAPRACSAARRGNCAITKRRNACGNARKESAWHMWRRRAPAICWLFPRWATKNWRAGLARSTRPFIRNAIVIAVRPAPPGVRSSVTRRWWTGHSSPPMSFR